MLNVQADVRARLVAALGVAVRAGQAPDGSAEDPFPAELVLVRRSGGRRLDALRDRPGVSIDVWAGTEARACALAAEVDRVMRRLPFTGGYDRVDMESMRSDYDLVRHCPRWFLSYTITTHSYE